MVLTLVALGSASAAPSAQNPAPANAAASEKPYLVEWVYNVKWFPDRDTLKRDENRRWELVVSHWDLPINEIDPHAAEDP